jgi:S1-C subfamily serine protease
MRGIMMARMAAKQSLYEILGIDRDANPIDVGIAYERRKAEAAKRVPPDANEIALVHEAYEVLSNPKRRAAYDASLVTAAEKAAASEQAPDLLLEPETPPAKKTPVVAGIVAGIVVLGAALYFTLHKPEAPKEAAAEPPKPKVEAPPPPPKPLSAAIILTGITSSVGQVMSYDMSGQANRLGLAVAVDRGVFATTCHGIPAGSALVVRIGSESYSATLSTTDEALDLCKLTVPEVRTGGLAPSPDELKPGDKVYVVGANVQGQYALAETKVKQLRPVSTGKVIELEVQVSPASSGGAVVDEFGRLVGIATTPHAYGAGLNIALPAAWLGDMRSRTKPQ